MVWSALIAPESDASPKPSLNPLSSSMSSPLILTNKNGRTPLKWRSTGFSLVEVSLALGIMAFALIALLALVPEALKTTRKAIQTSVSANVMQQVMSEVQLAEFKELEEIEQQTGKISYYFDADGYRVNSQDDSIYEAKIVLATRDERIKNPLFPGASPDHKYLNRLTVFIAHNPGGVRTDPFEDENNPPVKMGTLVARKEKSE